MEIDGELTQLIFFCSKCDKMQEPRHIRKNNARCKRCIKSTWRMNATFVNKNVTNALNVVGLASAAILGAGVRFSGGKEGQYNLDNVSQKAAAVMCKKMGGANLQVKQYIQYRVKKEEEKRVKEHQEELEVRGITCKDCEMSFIPNPTLAWHTDFFCSRSCWANECPEKADKYTQKIMQEKAIKADKGKKKKLAFFNVSCSNGHKFEANQMFIGSMRKCTECDEKVLIEPPQDTEEEEEEEDANTINVVCSENHHFKVNRVYLGIQRNCPECDEKVLVQESKAEKPEIVEELPSKPVIDPTAYYGIISEISNSTLEVIPDGLNQYSFYISCDGENLNYFLLNEENDQLNVLLPENAGELAQNLYVKMANDGNVWKEVSINLFCIEGEWRLQTEFV
ncbi:MAG: hypothetical protein NE328_04590 [Lentisphaeraceae bacterium]|nr:hypothetical protein [Lentisphaeraceae bacterium]